MQKSKIVHRIMQAIAWITILGMVAFLIIPLIQML